MNKIKIPVLLIGFNRPELIKQSLSKIAEALPEKLYVAVDGARPDKEGEDELVRQVKKVVENIDWSCQVHYRYNNTNKGAEITVSSAISWVLETEEYVIIIEDDVMASLNFFQFMEGMLIRYKDENSVAMVSGCNFTPVVVPDGSDYFFANSGHTWGWGTWKRVWRNFDLNIEIDDEHINLGYLIKRRSCFIEAIFTYFRLRQLKKFGKGNVTWDHMFSYYRTINNYFSIIPRSHLTTNVGVQGLHYNAMDVGLFLEYDDEFKVIYHPKKIKWFKKYDQYHFFKHVLFPFIKRWIKNSFK